MIRRVQPSSIFAGLRQVVQFIWTAIFMYRSAQFLVACLLVLGYWYFTAYPLFTLPSTPYNYRVNYRVPRDIAAHESSRSSL